MTAHFTQDTFAPRLAYVLDPRFGGGTSAAIAAELPIAAQLGKVHIHARRSAMFGDKQRTHHGLSDVIDRLGLQVTWDAPVISADTVILHNPAFLKHQKTFGARIVARDLIVVTHENFVRPSGGEGFDVAGCLGQIDQASLSLRKRLAPVSPHNRDGVTGWLAHHPGPWEVVEKDWFNIFDGRYLPPTQAPQDRRGRLSRPGFEKYPATDVLEQCFAPHAQSNVILGADLLINAQETRPHWILLPFGATAVDRFFDSIDFMVYFTAPTWRESFGRVIAEAIAAGKVVLTDPQTAAPFGDGVVACTPDEVDRLIAGFIETPATYVQQVARGQDILSQYSAEKFQMQFANEILPKEAAKT